MRRQINDVRNSEPHRWTTVWDLRDAYHPSVWFSSFVSVQRSLHIHFCRLSENFCTRTDAWVRVLLLSNSFDAVSAAEQNGNQ